MATQRFRPATFLVGDDDVLLRELGVPYGYIVIAGYDPIEVICLADARHLLQEARQRELITGDTAAQVDRQTVAAGLLENLGAIYDRARQHPMPKDYGRVVRFDTAYPETPKLSVAMRQGRVMSSTGADLVGGSIIQTLTDGFTLCRGLAKMGFVRLFDLCTLMRDMSQAGLAMDEAEYKARWEGLSATERTEIEAEIRTARERATAQLVKNRPLLAALFRMPPPDKE